jgi:hypothetical protein
MTTVGSVWCATDLDPVQLGLGLLTSALVGSLAADAAVGSVEVVVALHSA